MTGKDDYVTDGETVVQMSNGHELVRKTEHGCTARPADHLCRQLGSITGSGCMTGEQPKPMAVATIR